MAKPKENIPEIQKYTVEVEAMVPVVLRFNIEAEDEEKALQEAKKLTHQKSTSPPRFQWHKFRRSQISVYLQGTTSLLLRRRT